MCTPDVPVVPAADLFRSESNLLYIVDVKLLIGLGDFK